MFNCIRASEYRYVLVIYVYCLWYVDCKEEEEEEESKKKMRKKKKVACVLFIRTAVHICCSLAKVILFSFALKQRSAITRLKHKITINRRKTKILIMRLALFLSLLY
jgi:hypothetical protein